MGKSDVMTFEQPAELNRYLTIWTRPGETAVSRFWWRVKFGGPVVLLIGLILLERRWSLRLDPVQLLFDILPVVFSIALAWGIGWLVYRSKRVLSVYDDGLEFGRGGFGRGAKIRWKWIRSFHLEPCGPEHQFEKLTVRSGYWLGGNNCRCESIILAETANRAALLAELGRQQKEKGLNFVIDVRKTPGPPEPGLSATGFWLGVLGVLLFYQSVPMVFVGAFAMIDHAADITTLQALPRFCMALWMWRGRGIEPGLFSLVTGIVLSAVATGCLWRLIVFANRRNTSRAHLKTLPREALRDS